MPWLLACGLVAQGGPVAPGQKAPPLQVGRWLEAAPANAGGAVPVLQVIAAHPDRASLQVDRDGLERLRDRLLRHGIAVFAVVGDEPPAGPGRHDGQLTIGLCDDRQAAALFGWPLCGQLVILAADSRLLWRGWPGDGVRVLVDRALQGELQPVREAQLASRRQELLLDHARHRHNLANRVALQALVAHNPEDGISRGLLCASLLEHWLDRRAARAFAAASVTALADSPWSVRAFADQVLRCRPLPADLARLVAEAGAKAMARTPGDPLLAALTIQAWLRAGDVAAAQRAVAAWLPQIGGHAPAAIRLLAAFADAPDPTAFAGPAAVLLPQVHAALPATNGDGGPSLHGPGRMLLLAEYGVARCCRADLAAAADLLERWLGSNAGPSDCNREAWPLLTEPETRGLFAPMARGLVERMLAQIDQAGGAELDTCALERFQAGDFVAAVELQARANAAADVGDPATWQARLRRYRVMALLGPDAATVLATLRGLPW